MAHKAVLLNQHATTSVGKLVSVYRLISFWCRSGRNTNVELDNREGPLGGLLNICEFLLKVAIRRWLPVIYIYMDCRARSVDLYRLLRGGEAVQGVTVSIGEPPAQWAQDNQPDHFYSEDFFVADTDLLAGGRGIAAGRPVWMRIQRSKYSC